MQATKDSSSAHAERSQMHCDSGDEGDAPSGPEREKHLEAEAAVPSIQDQLDALDPATRAAVIARLTSDEVKGSAATTPDRAGTDLVRLSGTRPADPGSHNMAHSSGPRGSWD
jgi:hypothetical protein